MSRDEDRITKKHARIVQLVAERLGVPADVVVSRLNLDELEGRGVDSLDVEELAIELQEEFGDESGRKDN